MSADASSLLAEFAHGMALPAVPDEVREAAKLHVLDTIGCALAGYADGASPVHPAVRAFQGLHGTGVSTAFGSGTLLSAPGAAFVNSTASHSHDFDDTHYGAMVNVGAVIVPPVLAAAQQHHADGPTTLAAVLVGAEAMVRLGLAAAVAFDPSGFHPTSTCGVFAAALAVSRVMGLSEAETRRALGIAGAFAAGTYEPIHARSSAKALQVGGAAQSAVTSAALAAAGSEGPDSVLDGPAGFLRTYFGIDPLAALDSSLADLGSVWETPAVSFRAFAACTYLHGALEATQELSGEGLALESIRSVRVSIAAEGAPLVATPRDAKLAPRTSYDVRFSLPYAIAQSLVHGRASTPDETAAAIDDPQVATVARLVEYVPRDFGDSSFPGSVEIELDDRRLQAEVRFHRGGASRPMAAEDVHAKFVDNAAGVLGDDAIRRVASAILDLEAQPDVALLMQDLVARERSSP